jgi:predicted transcriptional regulator
MSCLKLEITEDVFDELTRLSTSQNRSIEDLIEEALRHYLASEQFKSLREITVPLAKAQGYLTDEDIFREVS